MESYKVIKDYKENQELNIEKIIKQYSGYVYTIIKNIASQNLKEEDIEEMIADTFFVLWKKQDKLENEMKISSYLAGIVKNLLKEKTRQIKVDDSIDNYENILVDTKNVHEIYEEQQKTILVEQSLQNMSQEDNKIFRLFYYAGKKVKEIAQELNITEIKVKTKLYRIRKKLKKDLMEGGY